MGLADVVVGLNQKCNSLLQKEIFISLLCRPAREMAELPSKATAASMVITQRSGSKDAIFYMTLKRKHMWLVISLHSTVFLSFYLHYIMYFNPLNFKKQKIKYISDCA